MANYSSRNFCTFLKMVGLFIFCAFTWYLGEGVARYFCEQSDVHLVSAALKNIYGVNRGQAKPAGVPVPTIQKCSRWSACPPGKYAFRILSGGGKEKLPKMCFEHSMNIDAGRGINIAAVNASSGKKIDSASFDMWEGDNSWALLNFIYKIPNGSFILMATYDDGSTKLNTEAKKEIGNLGSTLIGKIGFRSSWVFLGAKGFTIPENVNKEKILYNDKTTNRYQGWPAEIQIDGCI